MNDNNEMAMIPYSALEIVEAKHERTVKRLISAMVIIVALFVALIIGVLNSFCFEIDGASYSQDGRGYNVMGTNNEVKYGTEVGGLANKGEE